MKVLKDLQEKEEEDMESRGTFGNVKFLVIFFFLDLRAFQGKVGSERYCFFLSRWGV
jgi:hypothetical protein